MTSEPLKLEDFADALGRSAERRQDVVPEQGRKEIYDEGYSAGWDDAFKQASEDTDRVQGQIAAALQDLDFTYFEARKHIMASLKPLLEAMLRTVMPKAAQAGFVSVVSEETVARLETAEIGLELRCSPDVCEELSAVILAQAKAPITVKAEETLSPLQARLIWPEGSVSIDCQEALRGAEEALDRFYSTSQKVVAGHG